MVLSNSEIVAIMGIAVGVISAIISYLSYLNNKQTLKQSEKNLQLQLLHEDRKRALFELSQRITRNTNYKDVKNSIKDFLTSIQGQFLPDNTKETLEKELRELENFISQNSPYPEDNLPSDAEMKHYEKVEEESAYSEEERKKRLDPTEKFEEEFSEKFSSFKGRMIGKINSNLRKPEL